MMEIVDNNEEKKSLFSNKKVIAAVSGVAALLVVWVGVFVFTGTGKADAVNADPSSVDTVDPGKIEGLKM